MRVFVTGGTGLIGSRLIPALTGRGDAVVLLARKPIPPDRFGPACEVITGDPAAPGPWEDALAGCDVAVNLAGANLFARRWTKDFLREIRDSRVNATVRVAAVMARSPRRADGSPKVLVSGSAVGYYGSRGEEILTEDSPPGAADEMAGVTRDWEAATETVRAAGVRVVTSRTGIVLDADGGALPSLARPFKLFAGGRVGSGKQFVSWVHRDDMTRLLLFALDTAGLTGPVNAVAPGAVRNAEVAETLGKVLHRPNWLPVPRVALRVVLGKVVSVVAGGQRAVPQKLEAAGFAFRYPALEPALRNLYDRPAG